MVIIDAMPHRYVGPELTPNLWTQATSGGRAAAGGGSLPVSVTYANHAAFVTGAPPRITGIHGNHVWSCERGWIAAPKQGPRARTLFDDVADAGGRSALAVGDHKLVHQMGGARADQCWPPDGWFPDGTERCAFGYATDAAVLDALERTDLDVDLLVVHLNQPDTTSHLHGPDSDEALEQYHRTDLAYGAVIERLADGWGHTMVVTLSDHDQETITDLEPVELAAELGDLDGVHVAHEGTAALVRREARDATADPATIEQRVLDVPGVPGVERLDDESTGDRAADDQVWMAWTDPGRSFGATPIPIRGQHGSPRCRTQLAMVSGGHPGVAELAAAVAGASPSVLDWAPMIRTWLSITGDGPPTP